MVEDALWERTLVRYETQEQGQTRDTICTAEDFYSGQRQDFQKSKRAMESLLHVTFLAHTTRPNLSQHDTLCK